MKRTISILLSMVLEFSVIVQGTSTLASNQSNNAQSVFEEVCEVYENYDNDETKILEDADSEGVLIKDRLIVKTKSKINTFNAVDVVYGLGYAFIQFDNNESAEAAYNKYVSQGLPVQYDEISRVSAGGDSSNTYSKWGYEITEAEKTLSQFSGSSYSNVIVGVMDSGVDYTHSDFKNRIIRTNANFSDSGNENDEMDDEGHGTNVSSIIEQCTPDNVKIEVFKVGNNRGNLYFSSVICCVNQILQMTENRPNIINMSFTSSYSGSVEIQEEVYNSLIDAGITVVTAAGNSGTYSNYYLPSGIENAITVAASDPNNNRCDFSCFGDVIDIAAPGIDIYTAKMGGGYINNFTGTSASAPFASAGAAIILMQNPDLAPERICDKLQTAAVPVQRKNDLKWAGAGVLNFYNLIETDFESPVQFNYSGGEYNNTIDVTLTCPDKNSKIYYTTDNTIPSDTNGTEYKSPIPVTEFTKITAVAYDNTYKIMTSRNKHHSLYTTEEYQVIYNADESDFEISDDGIITAYTGSHKAFIMPDVIDGKTPVSIGNEVFLGSEIQHIELPDTVTTISNSAFKESKLQSIIGEGVTQVGKEAFMDCHNLYKEYLPNTEIVNNSGFEKCYILHDVSFKNTVTKLYNYCLGHTGLQEANFPNATIARGAFEYTPIISASLPKVKDLSGTFSDCYNLQSVYLPNIESVSDYAFKYCYNLTEPIDFSKVTKVGYNGFQSSYFTYLDLPNCTSVNSMAFDDVRAESINIPLVKDIYEQTFGGYYIKEINMPIVENFYSFSGHRSQFINCGCLEYLYLPNAKSIPTFEWDAASTKISSLKYIYAPKAKNFASHESDMSFFDKLEFIYAPSLENARWYDILLPTDTPLNIYLSSSYKREISDQPDDKNENITIIAPANSDAHKLGKKMEYHFCDSNSMVDARGSSIRLKDNSLKVSYLWDNLNDIEQYASNIEYGVVYKYGETNDLNINNGTKVIANNSSKENGNTNFDYIFKLIPNNEFEQKISSRGYVYIDGMYFYSDIITCSFEDIENAVFNDPKIDKIAYQDYWINEKVDISSVDISAFMSALFQAKMFTKAEYTKESIETLESVVNRATSVLEFGGTQSEFDSVVAQILDAIGNLDSLSNYVISTFNGTEIVLTNKDGKTTSLIFTDFINEYCKSLDVVDDGIVNAKDFAYLIKNYSL